MKIAIMQPYFFPYIGYFQLIQSVDKFVIYDNIEYTKKGWINRNRFCLNGKDVFFTIPIKDDSDYLCVYQRFLANNWVSEREKILRRIQEAYKNAPFFSIVFPMIKGCLNYVDNNLFNFILYSLKIILKYLSIDTQIIISSELAINHSLRSAQKVIAICKELRAKRYINPIGGTELYDSEEFKRNDITLNFLQTKKYEYPQFSDSFIPNLSIIDILMQNSLLEINKMLQSYQLINGENNSISNE